MQQKEAPGLFLFGYKLYLEKPIVIAAWIFVGSGLLGASTAYETYGVYVECGAVRKEDNPDKKTGANMSQGSGAFAHAGFGEAAKKNNRALAGWFFKSANAQLFFVRSTLV